MARLFAPAQKRRLKRGLFWMTALLSLSSTIPLYSAPGRIMVQRMDISALPEIIVYFTVLDDAEKAILGISSEEIEVRIDGISQAVSSLRSALEGDESLAVVLAFDRSGSMKNALEETKRAASDFLERMSAGDRVAVVSFDDAVRVDCDLSSDQSLVKNAIDGIDLGRDTALYEAIRKGLEILEGASTRRQALVILSDGKDTKSKLKRSEVLSLAKDKAVPIFTIGLGTEVDETCLIELASGTGGSFFPAARPQDLLRLYQTIAEQLRNQYILTFRSSFGQDDSWHDLELSFNDPAGKTAGWRQKFLATTSPGVSRGALSRHLGARDRDDLFVAAGLGALAGFCLGLFLFLLIRLTRGRDRLFWPLILGLVLTCTILGAIVGLLVFGIK
jgi:VWFA-related protein